MVKGISRQVIVVHSPDRKLFEQAIFILKDDVVGEEGVTDELLLKEAKRLINSGHYGRKRKMTFLSAVWAGAGAIATGIVWFITTLV